MLSCRWGCIRKPLVDALGADQALEIVVRVSGFDIRRGGRGFGLQVVAAGPRGAAPPVLEIRLGTAATGPHGRAVDGFLETSRQLDLGDFASPLDDDLRGNVAPGDDDQRGHDGLTTRIAPAVPGMRATAARLVASSP